VNGPDGKKGEKGREKGQVWTTLIVLFKVGPTHAPTHLPTSAPTYYFLVKNVTFFFWVKSTPSEMLIGTLSQFWAIYFKPLLHSQEQGFKMGNFETTPSPICE
jgi:hypothetical protein